MSDIVVSDIEEILTADLPWHRFADKNILVTGAAGMLPFYMVETLLSLDRVGIRRPRKVVGLVRSLDRARSRFVHRARDSVLDLVSHDISVPWPGTEGFDFIVHAASQASPKFYSTDPVGTMLANCLGTTWLLDKAKQDGSEGFLFFSSGEVYGVTSKVPTAEGDYGYLDPTNVRSCYGEAKRASETMCVSWAHQYGVPSFIVRPFHAYGPGMALDDGRVFADFVRDIVERRDIVMKSDGSTLRPFCYITDATVGFFTVLLKGQPATPYNVGNEEAELSILELAEMLVRVFPTPPLRVIRAVRSSDDKYLPSPVFRNLPDTARLRGLGWQPTVSAEEGFRRTVLSFST
ncbi:MAG: NAD-dependent epimerase/dehydratase family protein [Alphaproteobacteria bacterium]|nr:MAG: NAD-dependent epimerase/dehydratase family protein [Alphaproteobacteria bacterium]